MSRPMDYLVGLPVLCRIDEDGKMSLTVYAEDLVEAIADDGAGAADRALAAAFLEGGTAFACVPATVTPPPIDGAKPAVVGHELVSGRAFPAGGGQWRCACGNSGTVTSRPLEAAHAEHAAAASARRGLVAVHACVGDCPIHGSGA